MKIRLTHKCGHSREYEFALNESERRKMLEDLDCPLCAARQLQEDRIAKRIGSAFKDGQAGRAD